MYASRQDIIDRYGSDALYVAFDRDGDNALEPRVVDQALTDATEEINTYLAGRYSLPLVSVPSFLKSLCVDIALYKGSAEMTALTEEKRQRYEDAIKLLSKIAEGKVSLGIEKQAAGGSGGASFSANERRFSRDSLKGM